MSTLDNKNVLRYHEAFFNSRKNELCIVTENCANGDLAKKIQKSKEEDKAIPSENILDYFAQMCAGLKYMHDGKQILHRDLKPGNIFLAKNDIVKIGDLGSAKELSSAFTNLNEPNQGTKAYMAPERFQDPPKYGYPSDIFALGTIAYELFTL